MSVSERKFILDCDAGTDDAQALMMVLSEPSVKLVAVLTVYGNASCENTARNCLRILKFKNRLDIPVYKGSTRSLIGTDPACTNYHGKDGLGDIQIEGVDPVDIKQLPEEPAAVALVRMVNESPGTPAAVQCLPMIMPELWPEAALRTLILAVINPFEKAANLLSIYQPHSISFPGEITLVATGPLTNVALALHIDPELGTKLQDIYIMGGNTEGGGNVTAAAEFNFYSDPEAAYFVLNKLNKTVHLCSMEVCEKHGFSWEWYDKFTSEKTRASHFVHNIERSLVTRERQRGIAKSYMMVWDQVAMAVAINKELATETQDVYATVELRGTHTRGQLVIDWRNKYNKAPNVRLILKLNHKLFDQMMHMVIQD